MVTKTEMYTVVCDNCGDDIGASSEYSCWVDASYAEENAMEADWLKEDDKHYCRSCYSYGDNDELIINESRTKPAPTNPQEKGEDWVTEKPEFTEDCVLLTQHEFRGENEYNLWQIKKMQSDEGWYWGWLTGDGDEYGDIADMKATRYKVIKPLPTPPIK